MNDNFFLHFHTESVFPSEMEIRNSEDGPARQTVLILWYSLLLEFLFNCIGHETRVFNFDKNDIYDRRSQKSRIK
jgi:hypothetical protein